MLLGAGNLGAFEPLLEDRYYRFEYIRMWWPMQDYFGMSAARIANVLDFSPANAQAAALRQGGLRHLVVTRLQRARPSAGAQLRA